MLEGSLSYWTTLNVFTIMSTFKFMYWTAGEGRGGGSSLRPPLFLLLDREEKSLRHVAMVAQFLEVNKPKTSPKKWIRTASNFIDLLNWQMLAKFSRVACVAGAKSLTPFDACYAGYSRVECPYKEGKDGFCVVFAYSMKRACEIRKIHVAGVQRRQRNVQQRIMQVPICCFVDENVLLVCRSSSVAVVVGFVVIQK